MSKILTTSSFIDTDDKAGFLVWRGLEYNQTDGHSSGDNLKMGFDPDHSSDDEKTQMIFLDLIYLTKQTTVFQTMQLLKV